MGERFVHEGIEYEDVGDGNVRVIGPATAPPTRIGTPRAPDPAEEARSAAALEGQQLLNAQRRQALAEGNGRGGASNADNAADARRANLLALVDQINSVQALFESGPGATTGLGGLADYLPTDANRAFDAAGAGLVDQALASFRVPGIGAQSDADAARLQSAYGIQSSDRDEVIQQRLNQLRQRVGLTMRELGMEAPQWGRPNNALGVNLPRASLGNGPNGGPPGVAPVGEGAYRVPALAGLGREVAAMVQRGDDEAAIMAHINARHAAARRDMPGLQVPPEMGGFVSAIVDAHRRNPSVPVGSLSDQWGNLEMTRDVGGANPVLNAIGQVADTTLGAGIIGAANGLSVGALANESIFGDNTASLVDASRAERPGATLLGDIGGTALGMYGIGRVAPALGTAGQALTRGGGIGGDILYGAVRGANEAAPGEGLAGAGIGALTAGGGNLAGRGLFGAAGAAMRGVRDPAVRYLAARGVPMTPGMILGNRGITGRIASRLESTPFIGDMMHGRRMDSLQGFNRATVDEALQPIGVCAVGDTTPDMIGNAQDFLGLGDAYSAALDGVLVPPDRQFVSEVAPFVVVHGSIPNVGDEFDYTMREQFRPLFGAHGDLDGARFQDALQLLRSSRRDFRKRGNNMGQEAANQIDGIETALLGLAERSNPGIGDALGRANSAYRALGMVEDASIAARSGQAGTGVFTPGQLGNAIRTNGRRFNGRGATARGDVPLSDIQAAGHEVLPSSVPDSGTAGRLAGMLLPAALGGGAVATSQFTDNPGATGTLAALALLSTRQGNAALQRLLTAERPDTLLRAGQALANPRRRGLFGSDLATALLPAASQ